MKKMLVLFVLASAFGCAVWAADATAAPKLTPPKAGWTFTGPNKANLDLAFAGYAKDPVSTYLLLKQVLRFDHNASDESKLPADQVAWVKANMAAIKPYVLSILERDKAKALRSSDLRAAMFWALAQALVNEEGGPNAATAAVLEPAAAVRELFWSGKCPNPVWAVSAVSGELLPAGLAETLDKGPVSIGPAVTVTLSPPAGRKLLRVRAKITNISSGLDAPYAHWTSFGLGWDPTVDWWQAGKVSAHQGLPYRFLGTSSLFLVAGKELYTCAAVGEDCQVVWGKGGRGDYTAIASLMAMVSQSDGSAINLDMLQFCNGSNVAKGTTFDLDVVFSVPATMTTPPQLLVLGSRPVPVKMQAAH